MRPPIDAERHGAIPPLVNMATLGMMCERAGMLKIVALFFRKVFYILIPIKPNYNLMLTPKIIKYGCLRSSIEGNLTCFEHRIYINDLTGHKLQYSSVHG